jgi:hypothetical protein
MRARHILLSGLMLLFALLIVVTRPDEPAYTVSAVAAPAPSHLSHPCPGMLPEPPFSGLAPLSISWVPGMCTSDVYQSGYGDITVWQAGGHDYAGISGFAQRAFHIFNVDDPYHPVLLVSQLFPTGGTASTSIFAFKQGGSQFLSFTMRGSGSGCGFFVYNVDNPAAPQYLARKAGADWCTVHESFVSSDAQGNADYAWLTMSAESGSGYKVVAIDIQNLNNMTETGRFQRADSNGSVFAHDVTVVGNRVFVAHWSGGLEIFDKATLAHNVNPAPLNPVDSIRPAGFSVHHAWPTSDGNHVFIEDEFQNNPTLEKVKLYNISNISAPYYERGLVGPDSVTANNRAHNLKILNQSPGHDLLFIGWYQAGTRLFNVDTTGAAPIVTPVGSHQLRATTDGQFGDVWGVDYLPCTLHGQSHTCVYSSDMAYGLVVDALGVDPALDPYAPESQISDPAPGQKITSCAYTITGVAHDYYSGVAGVEVSVDGGATWAPATGTTNWTYQWTIRADGPYTIEVRARDIAGNLETPAAPVGVTVNGGCLSAPSAPPQSATAPASETSTATPTAPAPTATPPGATATASAPTATPSPTVCAVQFSDVHPGDYFYAPVRDLACKGVISGYADGTFRPFTNTTRGQMVKIVVGAFGLIAPPPPIGGTFADVPPTHPFFRPIEIAATNHVVSGYACGGPGEPCDGANRPYFRPYADVTRGQLAKIAVVAAGWAPLTPTAASFADVTDKSAFYSFVETAYCHGIISGYTCGGAGEPCDSQNRPYYRPGAPAVRAQIAKIVDGALMAGPGCAQTP